MSMLAGQAVRDRLSVQHQVTLSALWLGLNFQSSALLPIVVPAQVLLLIDRECAIYHPRGLRQRAMRRWPAETSMTVEELLRRYPEKSARSTVAR